MATVIKYGDITVTSERNDITAEMAKEIMSRKIPELEGANWNKTERENGDTEIVFYTKAGTLG